jgi:geranylgeranylglycerol-phosphate geranylgeranyltransferase
LNSNQRFNLKEKFFAHIETWRLYTVIWCGLVSFTGSCIAFGSLPPLIISTLSLFIPMTGWIAGLYLSDFLDRRLDAIQKPHRPIPSGRIKPKEALVFGAIFAVSGFILSFLLSTNNIILVFVVAGLVFAYAKLSKSRGITGNLNRGIVTVVAYFFGVFSINQTIESIPIYVWFISVVFLVHDTNSNLVGAIRDIEGDKKGGYQTIPVKYGVKNSIIISLFLTIIWFSLTLFLPYYYNFLKIEFYIMMFVDLIILICLYFYLYKAIGNYSREKGLKFHEFFVIERITLASAFIFGVINIYIAATIFSIAILITSISQYLLRKRYEFVEKK